MQTSHLPTVANPAIHADELNSADAAELQDFFDLNPEYFLICHGEPARPDEAVTELELKIPDGLACNRQWFIGFREHGVGLIAVEHIIKDLFIEGVWHIGLLILEASRHGKGDAQLIYAATEHWAVTQGARWLRIGVVRDNLRARRFWASQGFTKVCERRGVAMGLKENTIITMVKTLSGTSIPSISNWSKGIAHKFSGKNEHCYVRWSRAWELTLGFGSKKPRRTARGACA